MRVLHGVALWCLWSVTIPYLLDPCHDHQIGPALDSKGGKWVARQVLSGSRGHITATSWQLVGKWSKGYSRGCTVSYGHRDAKKWLLMGVGEGAAWGRERVGWLLYLVRTSMLQWGGYAASVWRAR